MSEKSLPIQTNEDAVNSGLSDQNYGVMSGNSIDMGALAALHGEGTEEKEDTDPVLPDSINMLSTTAGGGDDEDDKKSERRRKKAQHYIELGEIIKIRSFRDQIPFASQNGGIALKLKRSWVKEKYWKYYAQWLEDTYDCQEISDYEMFLNLDDHSSKEFFNVPISKLILNESEDEKTEVPEDISEENNENTDGGEVLNEDNLSNNESNNGGWTEYTFSYDTPQEPTEDRSSWQKLTTQEIVTNKFGLDYSTVLQEFKDANPGSEHWMRQWIKRCAIYRGWSPGDPIPNIRDVEVWEDPVTGEPVIEAYSFKDARMKSKELGLQDFDRFYWQRKISGNREHFMVGYAGKEAHFNKVKMLSRDKKTVLKKFLDITEDYDLYMAAMDEKKVSHEFTAFVVKVQEILFYQYPGEWTGMFDDQTEQALDQWLADYTTPQERAEKRIWALKNAYANKYEIRLEEIYSTPIDQLDKFIPEEDDALEPGEMPPPEYDNNNDWGGNEWAYYPYQQVPYGQNPYFGQGSYFQNDYGLYGMAGNVSEWVTEDGQTVPQSDTYQYSYFNQPIHYEGGYGGDYNNSSRSNYNAILGNFGRNMSNRNPYLNAFEYNSSGYSFGPTKYDEAVNAAKDEFLLSWEEVVKDNYAWGVDETELIETLKNEEQAYKSNKFFSTLNSDLQSQAEYTPEKALIGAKQNVFVQRKMLAESMHFFDQNTPAKFVPAKKMYEAWSGLLNYVETPFDEEGDFDASSVDVKAFNAQYTKFYNAIEDASDYYGSYVTSEDDFDGIPFNLVVGIADPEKMKYLKPYPQDGWMSVEGLTGKYHRATELMDEFLTTISFGLLDSNDAVFNLDMSKSNVVDKEGEVKNKGYEKLLANMFFPTGDILSSMEQVKPNMAEEYRQDHNGLSLGIYYYKKSDGTYKLRVNLGGEDLRPEGKTIREALEKINDDLPPGTLYFQEYATGKKDSIPTYGPPEWKKWLAIGGLILTLVAAPFTGGSSLAGTAALVTMYVGIGATIASGVISMADMYENGTLTPTRAVLELGNIAADLLVVGRLIRGAKLLKLSAELAKLGDGLSAVYRGGSVFLKIEKAFMVGVDIGNAVYISSEAIAAIQGAKNDEEMERAIFNAIIAGTITFIILRSTAKEIKPNSLSNRTKPVDFSLGITGKNATNAISNSGTKNIGTQKGGVFGSGKTPDGKPVWNREMINSDGAGNKLDKGGDKMEVTYAQDGNGNYFKKNKETGEFEPVSKEEFNKFNSSTVTNSGKISVTNSENSSSLDLKFWKKPKEIGGRKVYQRDDLFDPNHVDGMGRTNIERMQEGLAPIGFDGEKINMHHLIQQEPGPMAEVSGSFHQEHTKILHMNEKNKSFRTPDGRKSTWEKTKSGKNYKKTESDKAYEKWRSDYWKQRSKDFE